MIAQTPHRARLSGGLLLPYVQSGPAEATPALLLHGLSDDAHSFAPLMDALPDSLRATALTQRGHGDADRPAAGYELPQLARDAADTLDTLGIDRAVVVGHSMGAHVAMQFAADYPKRPLGLVLIGAFDTLRHHRELAAELDALLDTLGDEVDEAWAREFQAGTLAAPVDSAFFESVVRASQKVPPRVWRAAWAGMRDGDLRPQLKRVACPTLLIWGDRDAFATRAMQERLLRDIPDARLVVREGAGHGVHWEEPAAVAHLLAEFAAECASRAQGAAGSDAASRQGR